MTNSDQTQIEDAGPLMIDCPRCKVPINFNELSLKNAHEHKWGKHYVCDQCSADLIKLKLITA